MMKTSPKDCVHPSDYYVVNHLYESYIDVSADIERNPDDDDLRKVRKSLKRVLKFYGKEIE